MSNQKIIYLIDESLVKEIERKRKFIQSRTSGVTLLALGDSYIRMIEKESDSHSYSIEYPRTKKKAQKNGMSNIQNAMNWGLDYFRKNNKQISEEFIKELAGKIDPFTYKGYPANYRNCTVNLKGYIFTPPYPEKIPREMRRFISEANNLLNEVKENSRSPVEPAVFCHFHLVRIHPFVDGNGRTTRTLQNIILKSWNLPPATIYKGERIIYFELLENAKMAYRVRMGNDQTLYPSKEEREFYNYLATKVNINLDKILNLD